MGVKVEGAEELKFLLQQAGDKAIKGAFDQMRLEGIEIAELAQAMAPVDEFNLEQAIKVREDGPLKRNATGRFAKRDIEIYIDMDASAGNGKTVGDYAYEIHEHQAPMGNKYGLGDLSKLKQEINPSVVVGGGFMTRAIAEKERGLINRIITRVRSIMFG